MFVTALAVGQRTVTGVITDAKDAPIIGASVLVNGTKVGTVTDIDGKYSINVPAGSSILVYSLVGQKTEEVTIGASNTVNVVMKDDNSVLTEVS